MQTCPAGLCAPNGLDIPSPLVLRLTLCRQDVFCSAPGQLAAFSGTARVLCSLALGFDFISLETGDFLNPSLQ